MVIVCLLCQGLLSDYKSSSGRRLHRPHLLPLPALLAPRGSRGCRGHGRGGTEGGGPCTPFSAVCPAKVGANWRKREDLTESLEIGFLTRLEFLFKMTKGLKCSE